MKFCRLLMILAAVGLFCGAVRGAEPSIYCSYDYTVDADFGGTRGGDVAGSTDHGVKGILNSKRGEITDQKLRQDGISGKALLVGRTKDGKSNYSASYHPLGGLSPAGGSVSLWVSPQDWNGKDKQFHLFFSADGRQQQMILYKYMSGEKILFYYKSGDKITALEHKVSSWKEKEFHHLAAAWNSREISLYVDGVFSGSKPLAQAGKNVFTSFTIGTLNYWGQNLGTTLIDDVRIYNQYLTADDVMKDFSRHSGKILRKEAPMFLGITERTPVCDGRIDPGEYSFAGSGFRNLANRKYASNQARYFIAKDAKNLYFGMISSASDLRKKKNAHDSQLWEDDCMEIHLAEINGRKGEYQFIFNASDVWFDSRNGQAQWNSSGVKSISRITDGKWVIETVLPIANFTDEALNSLRLNLCRTYQAGAENTTMAPCLFAYVNVPNFAELRFDSRYPVVDLGEMGSLGSGQLNLEGRITGTGPDEVSVKMNADALILPFQFVKNQIMLAKGRTAAFKAESKALPRNRKLDISMTSKKCGEIYRASIEYMDQKPLSFAYLYTDTDQRIMNLVCRNSRIGGEQSTVSVCFISLADGSTALEKRVKMDTTASLVTAKVPLGDLKTGIYRMEYAFIDGRGREFFRSYELYRVYGSTPPWQNCRDGLEDEVPAPWTEIAAEKARFSCWGRSYEFGGGILKSMKSQGKELLAAPVSLTSGKQPVDFALGLKQKKNSFADYHGEVVVGGVRYRLDIRGEFDGYLGFRLVLIPEIKDPVIERLKFSIPLHRKYASYFDNCRTADRKMILKDMKPGIIGNNLSVIPMFWIGDHSVGLMGGMNHLRNWHTRNLNHSMTLDISRETVAVNWNFADEAFHLTAPRTYEFYLQTTPVKQKNMAAAALRDGVNTQMWTGGWCDFFEMQDPRFLKYDYLDQLRKVKRRVFHYATAKGLSTYSPDWNFYGRDWISSPPNLGGYQVDTDVSTRKRRNSGTFIYGCLNNRSFLDYKIYSLARMLKMDRVNIQDIYFDIAWPRSCDNPHHGCSWVDDFGRSQTSYDITGTREFYMRAYRMIRRKNPSAVFAGHLTSTHSPADSFFDILIRGEVYDRKVVEAGGYVNVFNPEALQVSESTRSKEQSIWMLSQFTRSLILFAPAKYPKYSQDDPGTDHAIRHYLGYLLLHNLVNWGTDVSKREKQILAAQKRLGSMETTVFHPYWEEDVPVSILSPKSDRVLLSSYSCGEKLMAVILNDTDQKQKIQLKFKNGAYSGRKAEEVFSGRKTTLQGDGLQLQIDPRGVRILLIE